MRQRISTLVAVALMALATTAAQAQVSNVFNMPTGQTSLQFVTVGDPGNAADPATGGLYGSVGYAYQMGKYDVTVGQYCQFLNAVAATDTYGLYNSDMAVGGYSGYFPTIGITQTGSSGSYNYAVAGSDAQAANCPIAFVSWGDSARFCNWLQNGQPSGAEGSGTTETGAYTLNGDTSSYLETRNAGAKYVIPSENEWYKAAYYDPSNASYWLYPTQNNTAPINTLPDTGNHANFYDWYHTGNGGYTDPTNYLTPVGAFTASPGPFGTFDMGGDLFQWNEATNDEGQRGVRGDSWPSDSSGLASSNRYNVPPTYGNFDIGFRVASVPEPSTVMLLLAGAACLLGYAWRPRTA